jgi:hypothetical protein
MCFLAQNKPLNDCRMIGQLNGAIQIVLGLKWLYNGSTLGEMRKIPLFFVSLFYTFGFTPLKSDTVFYTGER